MKAAALVLMSVSLAICAERPSDAFETSAGPVKITPIQHASLMIEAGGKVIQVDESAHRPITQELGIVAATKNRQGAQAFVDFLLKGKGRDILASHGYRVPGNVH